MAEREYKRLTRAKGVGSFAVAVVARSSLWLGRDHLLRIDSNGYIENYKRFYFSDIQSFTIRRTNRWRITALVCGALGGLFVLFTLLAGEIATIVVMGIVAGVLIIAAASELLGGPSAVCHLRTAVQNEELPSLNRVRQARRTINLLRPLIAQAQGGELTPEEVSLRLQPASAAAQPGQDLFTTSQAATDDPNAPPRIVP